MEKRKTVKAIMPAKTREILWDMIDDIALKTDSRDKSVLCTILCNKLMKLYKEETLKRMGIHTTSCIMQVIDTYLRRTEPLSWEEKVLSSAINGPIKLTEEVIEKAIKQTGSRDRNILSEYIYGNYKKNKNNQRAYLEKLGLTTKIEILKAIDAYLMDTNDSYTRVASFLFF